MDEIGTYNILFIVTMLQTQVDYFFFHLFRLPAFACPVHTFGVPGEWVSQRNVSKAKAKRSFVADRSNISQFSQIQIMSIHSDAISESAVCRPAFGSVLRLAEIGERSFMSKDGASEIVTTSHVKCRPCHRCLDHLGF